ncbi:MAG: F0F1 ATP synthase subunit epsilon [Alphaproteobacteria bacterium]|nr:F0F1 ATP synthase subunit epsilon [Alphaproteobacteria bacterium]
MAAFTFELVSPEKILFSGDVEQVVVPGTEGDFAVLKDHAPVMSALRPGVLTYTDAKGTSGTSETVFIRGGFVDATPSLLTVLADQAIPVANMTDAAFTAEVELATASLAAASTDEGKRLAAERLAQIEALRSQLVH